ncbi:MAG: hypothetical protein PHV82_19260 [Victivallaceae bacterium]|nr:hypothetical protein [Victivallaceae bacterium]
MSSEEKKEIKGTVWLWTVIGLVAGAWLGMFITGLVGGTGYSGGIIGAVAIGIAAYRSSKKNGGGPPSWLWRSKKK